MQADDITRMLDSTRSAIAAFESEKGKRLTPYARMLLEAVVLESLTTRSSEWRTRASISLDTSYGVRQASSKLSESLYSVLRQAWIKQSGDYITTRDILEAIHSKWCGIFPIC